MTLQLDCAKAIHDAHVALHNVRKENCPYCDMRAAQDKITLALYRLNKIPDERAGEVMQVLGEAIVDLVEDEPF
jgi:hypothetical protein